MDVCCERVALCLLLVAPQGFSAEQVLTGTNIEDLTGAGAGGKRQIKLTAAVVHDLKHDVRFLQQQADMKKFAQQTQKGNAKAHLHSAKERKKVRRALRKMNQVGGVHAGACRAPPPAVWNIELTNVPHADRLSCGASRRRRKQT